MIYEQHKIKIHSILFILCVLLALISPPYNQGSAQQNVIKEATGGMASWMVETIQSTGEINRKKEVSDKMINSGWKQMNEKNLEWIPCNKDCKINTLTWIWIRDEIAISLVDNCKLIAQNPVMCIKVWASIVMNESGGWYKCRKANKFNCFWIMQNEDYKSYHDATLHFAWKFQKWWRNAKDMSFFYSPSWSLPRSRYCTSEDSSGSTIGCPNGLRNSTYYFNKLNF